jgi:hypothetical protein
MKKITNFLSVSLVLFCIKTLNDVATAFSKKSSNGISKILIVPFFVFLLIGSSENRMFGQESLINKIYLQSAGGSSSYKSTNAEVGIQAILKKNWSTTLSYHQIDGMIPKNQPADYSPETGIVLFFLPYSNQLTTKMDLYSLTAGKKFPAGRKVWFTTEAGISLINGEKVTYTRSKNNSVNTDPLFFLFGIIETSSSNYNTNKESKTTFGGMLRADFNWAFSPIMGLGAGVFANFNSIQSPVGYNLKLTMGWMHTGKKK